MGKTVSEQVVNDEVFEIRDADAQIKISDIASGFNVAQKRNRSTDTFFDLTGVIEYTPSKFVSATTGVLYSSSISAATGFIDISAYDFIRYKIRLSQNLLRDSGIAFYDANKTYISGELDRYLSGSSAGYNPQLRTIKVPDGAKYVRCSTYADTTTYGNFYIEGHDLSGSDELKNQNSIADIKDVVFKRIISADDTVFVWNVGGIDTYTGMRDATQTASVVCDPIRVTAGSRINVQDGYKFAVALWSLNPGTTYLYCRVTSLTGEFVVPCECNILIAVARIDNAEETGVESNLILDLYTSNKNVPTIDEFNDAVNYSVDPDLFGYSFGGILDGRSTNNNKRIRILSSPGGLGAINVKAGSTIESKTGYKFNVSLYSSYRSASDFNLIGFRGIAPGSYTIPVDCYIRVSIGTIEEDVLWTEDEYGIKTYTQAGEEAKDGLIFSLYSGDVKTEIENIKEQGVSGSSYWEHVLPLDEEIPLNAVAFHELFDDMVTDGKLTRTLLGNVNNDSTLPVYLYRLANDMDHLASDYSRIPWDGSNELYKRSKVFLDSGVHGNERTTPFALFKFIDCLCNQKEYQRMRNTFDWYFVPLVNPWGFGHSLISKATGKVGLGGDWIPSEMDKYNVVDNTDTVHQGIRQTYSGIDINRDFSAFETEEANIIRDLLDELTEDERNFIFAIDSHQAAKGSAVNAIGAFANLNYTATQEQKDFVFNKLMQAGATTELLMADYCDVVPVQSVFPWEGSNLNTLRNFMPAYSDFSICFEGGQTCAYYSGSTEYSNRITRAFVNTMYHQFMNLLSNEWM